MYIFIGPSDFDFFVRFKNTASRQCAERLDGFRQTCFVPLCMADCAVLCLRQMFNDNMELDVFFCVLSRIRSKNKRVRILQTTYIKKRPTTKILEKKNGKMIRLKSKQNKKRVENRKDNRKNEKRYMKKSKSTRKKNKNKRIQLQQRNKIKGKKKKRTNLWRCRRRHDYVSYS